MTDHKKPELLAPAGSPDILKTAIRYGADAVYIGSPALSLRSGAKNAGTKELQECLTFAHARGKKVYVAVNVYAHEADIREARAYFSALKQADVIPDAFIISDPGIFMLAKELLPQAERHISTQMSTTNAESFRFWQAQGASPSFLSFLNSPS